MIITFGTGFYGKVATVNKHCIQTKFFHIMFVPLIPVSSMLVTHSEFRKRNGIELPLNTNSIIATYARLFVGILAIYLGYLANSANSYYNSNDVQFYYLSAALAIAVWVYFAFIFGKATVQETTMRMRVGRFSGVYAQPHWLEYYHLERLLKQYISI